jgi:hypothetical protein
MDDKQKQRLREEIDEKKQQASALAHERQLMQHDQPPDTLDPRKKSTGHGKKTADKWNQ